uniref:GT23 domain-containing protein n=1 Tax=Meloidogyne hapla TaxID=6305 RepID=A0A1I8BXH8_MELHA
MDEPYQNNSNYQLISNCTKQRKLFIAADQSVLEDVLKEVNIKWGNKYEIYHGKHFEQKSKEALVEILAITRILAKCQFVVCTFSSNACRLIYEVMQTVQGDASENVHSLDYFYSEYWMDKEMEAIAEYKPTPGNIKIKITEKYYRGLSFYYHGSFKINRKTPF